VEKISRKGTNEMDSNEIVDLIKMPSGLTYEDRYGQYLKVFESVYMSEKPVVIKNPPGCWIPLLWWLGAEVEGGQCYFEHDDIVICLVDEKKLTKGKILRDRTLLETLTGFRPELVDALWKSDMEWPLRKSPQMWVVERRVAKKDFVITNNGSFHRKEVLDYLSVLREFVPSKKCCVLVPCAADKPYPSKLHKAILEMLPPEYHIIVATGVLGLVPMELWSIMPWYDSGLPNEWRLMKIVSWYFSQYTYEKIVVYCDYYNEAIEKGLINSSAEKIFVNPIKFYFNYVDLLDQQRIGALRRALI